MTLADRQIRDNPLRAQEKFLFRGQIGSAFHMVAVNVADLNSIVERQRAAGGADDWRRRLVDRQISPKRLAGNGFVEVGHG